MPHKNNHIGGVKLVQDPKEVSGKLVQFENEHYYKISNYDAMRPFFMSIVSNSNHWLFIASNGGLTAGRQNSESALFPYYTDDKITESAHITGSKTLLQVHLFDNTYLWEPFSDRYSGIYKIQRNLYKNILGNKVVFEEVNEDLGLTYRYQWNSSIRFGFVKKGTLINNRSNEVEVSVLDGIQNIMPYGVNTSLQNASSNLIDAYKKNELEVATALGIYSLSAIIVDRAEPSEALKATTVWSAGIEASQYLISSRQIAAFRKGQGVTTEVDIRAEKGAYFMYADITLTINDKKQWITVAEVNQSSTKISELTELLKDKVKCLALVEKDIENGSSALLELNGAADALQLTADTLRNARHFSNTLFNIMRGGIFDHHYEIEKADFIDYLKKANKELSQLQKERLEEFPMRFDVAVLRKAAQASANSDFKRLALEYMPLKFSRRHGDPSRPWNKFSINTTDDKGNKVLDYEGNWRDIFQNWEALAHSYPVFIDSMIHKFLNATTFDGYNPYRVTKDGFDWEAIEPDDPWSYIGYWGDHQIIYLLKFLEFSENHFPDTLASYFNEDIFVYANVPYKIKRYEAILKDPKDTIVFDDTLDEEIRKERLKIGADAALLKSQDREIYRVNLLEKLLAPVLAKISNFIPEGGIWMNTQRPEWNDANNALVGNGVSMVTLYYLRRFLSFFEKLVEHLPDNSFYISQELITFFNNIRGTLNQNLSLLSSSISDTDRKTIMDGLGIAGSDYRATIYKQGFANKKASVTKDDLLQFTEVALKFLEHSIDANQRTDKLFHSYNLMTVTNENEVSISHLSEMLEGQVAVLSAGYINSKMSLEVLDALKASTLFRSDQYSYLLYPNKELPRFVNKNTIRPQSIKDSQLVRTLLKNGNISVIEQDVQGNYHFNGSFNNAESLSKALSALPNETYGPLVRKERQSFLNAFEAVFDHKSFTGRSGTFFGYEGLGSIYWHMVSKLLLSVQETCLTAFATGERKETIGRLLEHYYEINEGIGVHKSPELYGAFPIDPYSHTPAGKGAQQPGMTGQVKEDILSRFGELGVFVKKGCLVFNPCLLRKAEFLKNPQTFQYTNVAGDIKTITIAAGSLCFTYCQVPVVYQLNKEEGVSVLYENQSPVSLEGLELDLETSQKIFRRSGEIEQITVSIAAP